MKLMVSAGFQGSSEERGALIPHEQAHIKALMEKGIVEALYISAHRPHVWIIMQYLPEAALAFNEIMVQGFSEAEQRDLLVKLQKIIANLSAIGPGIGDRFGLLPDFMRLDQQGKRRAYE